MTAIPENLGRGGIDMHGRNPLIRTLLVQASERDLGGTGDMVPNAAATVGQGRASAACTVRRVRVTSDGPPASVGGTALLVVQGGGNNLLAAASFDLETLAAGTSVDLTLTAVTADRTLAAGDLVTAVATSNNADLTGGTGLGVEVLCDPAD